MNIIKTEMAVVYGKNRLCYLIECDWCHKLHYKATYEVEKGNQRNGVFFCSKVCFNKHQEKIFIEVACANCFKKFLKLPCQIKKTNNNFCTKSCAATYNNKHKKYGTRRSKLEIYIEENLKQIFSNLLFKCNEKETIGSELYFYFPNLKIAIQLNGIFHYEPIYGDEKLLSIQKLDVEKREKCSNLGIQLYEINCSTDKYLNKILKEQRWNQVKNILDLAVSKRFELLKDV